MLYLACNSGNNISYNALSNILIPLPWFHIYTGGSQAIKVVGWSSPDDAQPPVCYPANLGSTIERNNLDRSRHLKLVLCLILSAPHCSRAKAGCACARAQRWLRLLNIVRLHKQVLEEGKSDMNERALIVGAVSCEDCALPTYLGTYNSTVQ